ncbi:hypothetical protein BMR05_14875 [Methylococcaceae bacterium HT4]|nr:hypothetical protein BMR05_14875 [Methylococcaceae bacterium HT4]TXL20711.1 hypothetical protein BMR03_14105 [Methylococcaceae bacterium HT2]
MSILEGLSKKILLNEPDLWKFISSAPHRYKKYKIEKRNGKGFRDIAQPSKELKFLQNTAVFGIDLFQNLPIHHSAKAYIKKINIKDNAEAHKLNSYFLKMDFSNFFPSIKPVDFINHIEKHKNLTLSEKDKLIISKLFFYKKYRKSELVLSVGSPTSPYISNTLMYDFDDIVYKYCIEKKITYTRYADDLTFSTMTKVDLFEIPVFIKSTLNELLYPRILINNDKTVFLSKRTNRHITGLVITNDGKVSIGRKKKRYIQSLVYKYCNSNISEESTSYLKGYLAFCLGIDVDFVISLEKKYGKENIDSIRGLNKG